MNILSLFKKNEPEPCELIPFIRLWMARSKRTKQYKARYLNMCNKLVEFEKYSRLKLYSDSFTEGTTDQFVDYLRNVPEKKLLQNTIRKILSLLVTMLNRAQKEGCKVSWGINDVRLSKEYIEAVSLVQDDLDKLNNMKLKPEAAAVRDRFLLGCYTLQRFSDYSRMKASDIINGVIYVKQVKTGAVVVIPVHPVIYDILDRNGGEFPSLNSIQAFNTCLKRLCKKAGINDIVSVERTRGNKVERLKLKKYDMVGSHTARRTGATLMYLAGIPTAMIMKITGHTTEQSFFQYIRIDKLENAKDLAEHPFFKKKQYVCMHD